MNTYLLGMRGATASGSERTFEGQPVQPGNHLRWGFAPELGFPPGGFRLCRKVAGQGERHITPPHRIWTTGGVAGKQGSPGTTQQVGQTSSASTSQGGPSISVQGESGKQGQHDRGDTGSPSPLPWRPGSHEWHARLPETCHQVSIGGLAAEGVEEVILETYVHVSLSKVVITGRHCAKVINQHFSATVRSDAITTMRVLGVSDIHNCECSIIDPPRNIIRDDNTWYRDRDRCGEDDH